jgi:hypothetical protein
MRLPQWQPDVYIKCQWPDEHSKMTHPYLYVTSRFGCVPWKETVVEMFDRRWEVYQEDVYLKKLEEINKKREEMFAQAIKENAKKSVDPEKIGEELLDNLMNKEEKEETKKPEEVDK